MIVALSFKHNSTGKYASAQIDAKSIDEVDGLVDTMANLNYKLIGTLATDSILYNIWRKKQFVKQRL